jgi:hypothetical protein
VSDLVDTGLSIIDPPSQQVEINELYESVYDALNIVPDLWKWAATLLQSDDDGWNFAKDILWGTAKVMSDGSFKDEAGTLASITKGNDQSKALVLCNLVPGRPKEQSAYHSELAGVVGSLILIWIVGPLLTSWLTMNHWILLNLVLICWSAFGNSRVGFRLNSVGNGLKGVKMIT